MRLEVNMRSLAERALRIAVHERPRRFIEGLAGLSGATADSGAVVEALAHLTGDLVELAEVLGVRSALNTTSPFLTGVKTPAGVFDIVAAADTSGGVPGVLLVVFRRRFLRRPAFVTAFRPGEHAAAFWLLAAASGHVVASIWPRVLEREEESIECVTYNERGEVVGREPVKGTK